MRTVFLDTVGLLALWNRSDQWHAAARASFDGLDPARTRLITSGFVMLECGNAAARHGFRSRIPEFRADLRAAGDLIEPTPFDVEEAWEAYRRGAEGSASFVDLTSFVVMRRLGVSEAFTNDRHFAAAGFVVLL